MRLLVVLLVIFAWPALAARSDFESMDGDRDGRISAAEHAAVTRQMFEAMDADVLTAAEHEAGSRMMFGKMDANKDGYLSRSEWTAGHAALADKRN